MKKILLFFMMMVMTITVATSCSSDDDGVDGNTATSSQLVGVWRDIDTSDGNEDWTFNANGTGNLHFDDINVNGHSQIDFEYALIGNQLNIMMILDGKTDSGVCTVSFSEDGKLMYMDGMDEEGKTIVLRKIK